METIHGFINDRCQQLGLPESFFLHVSSYSCAKKNGFLLGYIEYLVVLNVFRMVNASFLTTGRTHADISACFSRTKVHVRQNDAVTLQELHHQLHN